MNARPAQHDERLLSVLFDWWFNMPLGSDINPGDPRKAALDDMVSLVDALDAAGFDIVARVS